MPKRETISVNNSADLILAGLAQAYPEVKSGLLYNSPFQLFVATVLSAQTTDEQVNRCTELLFEKVPDVYALASLNAFDIEPYIKSLGLYRHKSRYLSEAARIIVRSYGGEIPSDFDELLKLPGVGRKTANVIISGAFNQPGLAVDTHVFRVSRRLGIAGGSNPDQVEAELKGIVPRLDWSITHHRLISHGRLVCHARKPRCDACVLSGFCRFTFENV